MGVYSGMMFDKSRYILIYKSTHPFSDSHGYIREHRLVVEQYLSKKIGLRIFLGKSILVHHKNNKPWDNRIENLQIMTKKQHNKHHLTGINKKDMSDRKCRNCNSKTTLIRKDGSSLWKRNPITKEEWYCTHCFSKLFWKINYYKNQQTHNSTLLDFTTFKESDSITGGDKTGNDDRM